MREAKADIWSFFLKEGYVVLVTTNGSLRKDGACVMGRGTALQALTMFPLVQFELGALIKERGNVVHQLSCGLMTFPVKHRFWEKAEVSLINRSARQLEEIALRNPQKTFVLPRPGCGWGQLTWEQVRPYIDFLPDNVLVVTNEEPC